MTTIASLAVFFVTTRLVNIARPADVASTAWRSMHGPVATAERSSSRQVTPHATNANNGKHRQGHRRSCAWALTTGLARNGDSRDNSSTVMHVVKPQHSKLTTSKSGSNDNGGLL